MPTRRKNAKQHFAGFEAIQQPRISDFLRFLRRLKPLKIKDSSPAGGPSYVAAAWIGIKAKR